MTVLAKFHRKQLIVHVYPINSFKYEGFSWKMSACLTKPPANEITEPLALPLVFTVCTVEFHCTVTFQVHTLWAACQQSQKKKQKECDMQQNKKNLKSNCQSVIRRRHSCSSFCEYLLPFSFFDFSIKHFYASIHPSNGKPYSEWSKCCALFEKAIQTTWWRKNGYVKFCP